MATLATNNEKNSALKRRRKDFLNPRWKERSKNEISHLKKRIIKNLEGLSPIPDPSFIGDWVYVPRINSNVS